MGNVKPVYERLLLLLASSRTMNEWDHHTAILLLVEEYEKEIADLQAEVTAHRKLRARAFRSGFISACECSSYEERERLCSSYEAAEDEDGGV